ncbi:MAG: tRNA lysidine(34) synthetase TilS [Psychroflexus halocasei]|uniref:tRNA lysidine(34) synthetase TilS n=1 Tax=Psychroflexus sp. S27 TaxID=1982757 RepID=UPI000C29B3D3|nr:tRNA lysidine(34) synthetase TilS [Psychroflexus sp. S27]PJX24674.1 tRNA lysidine(34) synthetase TilS [Psychroflexus sp. S27]
MLSEFQQHLSDQFSELKKSSFLIACSGGVDSMVLTDLCLKSHLDFALAHCNFQLREIEADKDEAFVKDYALQNGINFFNKTFDTHAFAEKEKLSIQEAARELRYTWFKELLKNTKYDYLITAHHLNDSIETFMINLFRGTGLAGLTGIPNKNDKILRPLLVFSRAQIEDYANKNELKWKEDITNASTKYVRNAIRHEVTPILEKQTPQLYASFLKIFDHLKADQNLLNDYISQIKTEVCIEDGQKLKISIKKLETYTNKKTILFHLLKDKGFKAWDDIVDLLSAETGKFKKSQTHLLMRDGEFLSCKKLNKMSEINKSYQLDNLTDKVSFEAGQILFEKADFNLKNNPEHALINPKKLNFPLFLRKTKSDDKFSPLGMTSRKRVWDYLKDKKVSVLDRKEQWVLTDQSNIIWVVGHQIDENYKVLNTDQKCIKVVLVKP